MYDATRINISADANRNKSVAWIQIERSYCMFDWK